MSTQFLSVVGARSLREVEAYLYGGSEVVESGEYRKYRKGDRTWAIVEVNSAWDDAAQLQADRYSSGLIGAKAFDTIEAAKANVGLLAVSEYAVVYDEEAQYVDEGVVIRRTEDFIEIDSDQENAYRQFSAWEGFNWDLHPGE